MKKFLLDIVAVAEKDLRIELRTRQTLFASFLFVALMLFIFNFSFSASTESLEKLAGGMLWIVIAFSGTIMISHLTSREREDRINEGLLLSGCGPVALFFSKFITALIFMMGIEIITIPLFMIFFNFSFGDEFPLLLTVLALGTIGYASVGTLFSTLLCHIKFRELLLPIIFYPVIIPLLVAATQATSALLAGERPKEILFMFGFNVILVTASALLYEFVVEDPI